MNNSEYIIEESKDVALVVLNQTWQVPGKINIIYYQKNGGGVDFLYAIGKASGFGPSYYSMVQEHEETPVITITDSPSDVSTLKHKEKALAYNTETSKWYMLVDVEENGIWTRHMTELISPAIYRNLDDSFRWFYNGTVMKREDDFLSTAETEGLVIQNIEYFQRPTLEITLLDVPEDTAEDGTDYYLPEDTVDVEKPGFTIRVINYKGEDDTSKYTISLNSEDPINYEDGKYVVYRKYTTDFELPICATKNNLQTTKILKVWFPIIALYGSCIVSDVDHSIIPRRIRSKLIYHNLERLDLDYELDNERSILYLPIDPKLPKFSHIYDRNGLDYIENYIYYPGYEYSGTVYQAYLKNEPIVQKSLEQRFTYLDELLDVPNSGWLRELDKEDYYTKEQIDERFQDYPMIRLEGDKLIIGDHAFRLTPWIDNADYWIGITGGTRESFYGRTKTQVIDDASPYMVESSPTFAYVYTEDNLLDYDYLSYIGYGQSLGKGWGHGVLTTIAKYGSNELMWGDSHKYTDRTDTTYTNLVPLKETTGNNNANGETAESKALETTIELFLRNKYPLSSLPKFIASNMAVGGANINQLIKGTTPYNNIIAEVTATKAYCDSIGRTYAVAAVSWTQGESSLPGETNPISKADYKTYMNQLIVDLNDDIKLITGQNSDIKIISYQTPTLKQNNGDYQIQEAFIELAQENRNFIFASAIYDSTWVDFYHIDAISTCKMGCRYGAAFFGLLTANKYCGIIPTNVQIENNGTEIYVTFDTPYPPLKLTSINGISNYGFSIKDGNDNELITNVEIRSNCQIKITTSSDASGLKIKYAENSGHHNGLTAIVGVGGFSDSMGTVVSFEESGVTYNIDNLAPILEIQI